jgi:pimeloyl-ACP methyl ester carboxylesterase/putative sterol carrier protein
MGRRSETPAREQIRGRVLGLPRRLRAGSANGLNAQWLLRVGDADYWVTVAGGSCTVVEGTARSPDTTLITDPETWLSMDAGRLMGVEAFLAGRLQMHGNIDLAVRLQTLFVPHRRARASADLDQLDVDAGGTRVSTYVLGTGRPLVLLHGLGATKISWLPFLAPLSSRYRLIVPDLPGHGESAKPKADYSPQVHASTIRCLMDELDMGQASIVGNSLGGRIALEMALRWPERVRDLSLLDPSVPGLRWRYLLGFARIIPSEVGAIPFPLRERWVEAVIRRLFADPARLGNASSQLAAAEFIRVNHDAAARMAFVASLRHIVTERPNDFYRRLEQVGQRTLVLFGAEDRLIPPALGARLAQHIPNARLIVLEDCGHVPQFEATDATLDALVSFLEDGAKRKSPV